MKRFKRGIRGIFGNRKAQTEHESMWTLSELVFFSIFVVTLLVFASTVWKNTTYQQNFLARDMAMTLDTLYISPQRITITYPHNVSQYNFIYVGELARVGEADSFDKRTDRMYWFADEQNRRLDYMNDRIVQPETILYSIAPHKPLIITADNYNPTIGP